MEEEQTVRKPSAVSPRFLERCLQIKSPQLYKTEAPVLQNRSPQCTCVLHTWATGRNDEVTWT